MTIQPVQAVQALQPQEALALHAAGAAPSAAPGQGVQQAMFEALMQQAGTQLSGIGLASQDALRDEDA